MSNNTFNLADYIRNIFSNSKDYLVFPFYGILGLLSINMIIKKIKKNSKRRESKHKAEETIKIRNLKIDEFLKKQRHNISEERMKYIYELDATGLLRRIRSKEISAVEALLTYAIRAGTIGKELNYICDVDFGIALNHAIEIDNLILHAQDNEIPPLAGLPISVKDQISVRGTLTTIGYSSMSNNIDVNDSYLISVLRRKGAIIFTKSNTPQGSFTIESANWLWGASLNPWNIKKSTGGSSAGEAGLVATKCSPLGIGSDLTGSIRAPANFCGVHGFKPTRTRVSAKGAYSSNGTVYPANQLMSFSWGPIARSVEDCVLFCKHIFGEFIKDDLCNNVYFNDDIYSRSLASYKDSKIGYCLENPLCETAPCIKETILEVVQKLKLKGFEMVQYPLENFIKLVDIGTLLLANSEFDIVKKNLDDEESGECYKRIFHVRTQGTFWRKFMSFLKGGSRQVIVEKNYKKLTLSQYIEYSLRFMKLKDEFIRRWLESGIEAIICPVLPTPAFNLDSGRYISPFNYFLFLFNCMDMPAGNVPLKLCFDTKYFSRFNDVYSKEIEKNLSDSLGLPLGIQVATLPNQDEWCLRVMKEIDSIYKFDINLLNTSIFSAPQSK